MNNFVHRDLFSYESRRLHYYEQRDEMKLEACRFFCKKSGVHLVGIYPTKEVPPPKGGGGGGKTEHWFAGGTN